MSTLQQFHVDAALSNVSVDFTNMDYIGERFAPVVPVAKKSDVYFVFSKEAFDILNANIAPGSDYQRIEINLDKRGYFMEDGTGLEYPIPDALRENADPATQLDIQATKKLTERILLIEENNIPANVLSSSQISSLGISGATLSGTGQWTDYVNSDPFPVIDSAKLTVANNIGRYPNTLTMSDYGFYKLRNHPALINRYKFSNDGLKTPLSEDQMKDLFGVETLLIAKARSNTALLGQTSSLGPVWGKNVYLSYIPKSPGLQEPAFMYTFLWTGGPFKTIIRRYREEWRNQDVLQIQKWYVQQVVAPGAAYIWQAAFA